MHNTAQLLLCGNRTSYVDLHAFINLFIGLGVAIHGGHPIYVSAPISLTNRKTERRKNMGRWKYLALVFLVLVISGCNTMYGVQDADTESEWPWKEVTPVSQGMESEALDRMVKYINGEKLRIHSVIIYKNGTVPFEAYFNKYNKDVSHNMKSTSKGVISVLIGIALREGYIESLDENILTYFPEYSAEHAGKPDITIRDLLTMSSGLKWKENGLNSMYTFFVSKRIVKRVLNLSLESTPGSTFNYNTGLTHLLSAIISKASGMSTLDFARRYLFEPLDIENVQWDTDRDGYHIGGSELFITPRAMIKLGVMYLQNGIYQGKQIIPAKWVAESTETQIQGTFHGTQIKYGFLWWLNIGNPLFTYLNNANSFVAMGVRGQRIFISPDNNMVVVITADQRDESQCDMLIRDYIIPAVDSNK
jgi:CubicO group peptidase (beta-lactamase class C family)